jgi:propionate CoA-transferase
MSKTQASPTGGTHPMLGGLAPGRARKGKIVSAEEAVRILRDGDTVLSGGFVGSGYAELVSMALEKRFLESGSPKGLTFFWCAGQGDGKGRGLDQLAHEGLVKRVVGGHFGLCPKLGRLAIEGRIEAYNFPQGTLSQMLRDAGAHRPRTITRVGIGTFVDPRLGGGRVNASTTEPLVELLELGGEEYLAYRPIPIDVAILRGTTSDTQGNVTMEREALELDGLAGAIAAKNSGGFVIVQVERIAEHGALSPRDVVIPGVLVDCVVVSPPEHHWQTFSEAYNPAYSGELRVPTRDVAPLTLGDRKIIARRAALELRPNSVVNLGIGMPEGIASVANEEKILEYLTLTAEPGTIGGITAGGLSFGAATNPDAIIDMTSQFDFYDGGGLDAAFLGMAEADQAGNVNVSRFGPKLAGCGGFVNISQNARRVVFMGTFTAGGLELAVETDQTSGEPRLRILKEGKSRKFVEAVEQITFAGRVAAAAHKPVLYVTERCVFSLDPGDDALGLTLVELAPGIDLERDLLAQMAFRPVLGPKGSGKIRAMDLRIFRPEPMGLSEELLRVPLGDRLRYDPTENLFFLNFEGMNVRSMADVTAIEEAVAAVLGPVGRRVHAIVNYDSFQLAPDLLDAYTDMVKRVVERWYSGVTRYTTSAFLRMKLGKSLADRSLRPHIYETASEARLALHK